MSSSSAPLQHLAKNLQETYKKSTTKQLNMAAAPTSCNPAGQTIAWEKRHCCWDCPLNTTQHIHTTQHNTLTLFIWSTQINNDYRGNVRFLWHYQYKQTRIRIIFYSVIANTFFVWLLKVPLYVLCFIHFLALFIYLIFFTTWLFLYTLTYHVYEQCPINSVSFSVWIKYFLTGNTFINGNIFHQKVTP